MIAYHFKNKLGLYHALLTRHFQNLRERFYAAGHQAERDPAELASAWPELHDHDERMLAAALFEIAQVIVLDECMHKILLREMMNGGKSMVKLFQKEKIGVIEPIIETLKGLVASGRLNAKIDLKFRHHFALRATRLLKRRGPPGQAGVRTRNE